ETFEGVRALRARDPRAVVTYLENHPAIVSAYIEPHVTAGIDMPDRVLQEIAHQQVQRLGRAGQLLHAPRNPDRDVLVARRLREALDHQVHDRARLHALLPA